MWRTLQVHSPGFKEIFPVGLGDGTFKVSRTAADSLWRETGPLMYPYRRPA